jgi:hypothetical protein
LSSSLNPFAVEYRVLRTRLAPEECSRRLEPLVIPWSSRMAILWSAEYRGRPLIGAVSPAGFELRKKLPYKNDLQTEAAARFELAPDGTRMRVRLGARSWVLLFLSLWLSIITVVMISVPYLCRAYPKSCHGNLPPGAAFGVPILAVCILALGRWLSRNDAEFLISFLKEKLQAEEVPEAAFPAQSG